VKVNVANKALDKRKRMSAATKLNYSLGLIVPLTDESRKKAVVANKLRAKERRAKPIEGILEKREYRKLCQFSFNLKSYPSEFDFSLIEKYGWYSAKNRGNNINGVSRDHKLSISDGWKLKIPPSKISHPANCELMRHSDNFNKRTKSSITEKELDNLILIWYDKYHSLGL